MTEHEKALISLTKRINQMQPLAYFRPYWSYNGPCNSNQTTFTAAGDIPCPCPQACFNCQVFSYTRTEYGKIHPSETFPAS